MCSVPLSFVSTLKHTKKEQKLNDYLKNSQCIPLFVHTPSILLNKSLARINKKYFLFEQMV